MQYCDYVVAVVLVQQDLLVAIYRHHTCRTVYSTANQQMPVVVLLWNRRFEHHTRRRKRYLLLLFSCRKAPQYEQKESAAGLLKNAVEQFASLLTQYAMYSGQQL